MATSAPADQQGYSDLETRRPDADDEPSLLQPQWSGYYQMEIRRSEDYAGPGRHGDRHRSLFAAGRDGPLSTPKTSVVVRGATPSSPRRWRTRFTDGTAFSIIGRAYRGVRIRQRRNRHARPYLGSDPVRGWNAGRRDRRQHPQCGLHAWPTNRYRHHGQRGHQPRRSAERKERAGAIHAAEPDRPDSAMHVAGSGLLTESELRARSSPPSKHPRLGPLTTDQTSATPPTRNTSTTIPHVTGHGDGRRDGRLLLVYGRFGRQERNLRHRFRDCRRRASGFRHHLANPR